MNREIARSLTVVKFLLYDDFWAFQGRLKFREGGLCEIGKISFLSDFDVFYMDSYVFLPCESIGVVKITKSLILKELFKF